MMRAGIWLGVLYTACVASAQVEIFEPKVAAVVTNCVPLTIWSATNLQLIHLELNGQPCTLLFDTGASHTTLNSTFVKRAFPNAQLQDVELAGNTNVAYEQPKLLKCDSLKVGNTTLTDFYCMVLNLDHVSQSMGRTIDGVFGVNLLRYAPSLLDLRAATITWVPDLEGVNKKRLATFAGPTDCFFVMAQAGGKQIPMLVDSGASYTFVPRELWPASKAKVSYGVTGVNENDGAVQRSFPVGEAQALTLGPEATLHGVTPRLSSEAMGLLGAEVMGKMKFAFDFKNNSLYVVDFVEKKPAVPLSARGPLATSEANDIWKPKPQK